MRLIAIRLGLVALGATSLAPAWAASPASGEVNDDALVLEWTGGGPYVIPNLTGQAGDPVCEPQPLPLCDQFALTVNLSDEFRELPENARESVKFGISFPTTIPTVDYDVYLMDSGGAVLAQANGSFGVQDAFSMPLKTLKNGSYTVTIVPFTGMATNYTGKVQVGKAKDASPVGLSISPQAGAAPLAATFDARALAGAAPAGGYVFDFGDGTAPLVDEDGVVQHTYERNGQYLAQVRTADANGIKAAPGAAVPVYVGDVAGKSGKSGLGGALGLLALLPLGLVALRRRRA